MQLTLVTTPIGNLNDITERAKNQLRESDLIISEDTRVTKTLLEKLRLDLSGKKIISFNDHQKNRIDSLISQIKAAKKATLVSDAGSPLISDPGFPLIGECLKNDIKIDSNPGVSAPLVALELSGLPPHPFTFHGFLGRKKGEIQNSLETANAFGGTHIYFESPHRIISTLSLVAQFFPDAEVCVARELTKMYQSIHRFKASDYEKYEIIEKGEFVLLVYFDTGSQSLGSGNKDLQKLSEAYLKKQSPKNLAKLISGITGEKVSDLYSLLVTK